MRNQPSETLLLRAAIIAAGGKLTITSHDFFEAEAMMRDGESMRTIQMDRPPIIELEFKRARKEQASGLRALGNAIAKALDNPKPLYREQIESLPDAQHRLPPVDGVSLPARAAAPPAVATTPSEAHLPGWKHPTTTLTAANRAGTNVSDFVALAACLEYIGGHIEVAPGFMGILKPGDHITRRVMADGSLELRLVHVPQEFVDPPELWPSNDPRRPKGML